MLPNINSQQWHQTGGRLQWILIGPADHFQTPTFWVITQPPPTGTLHCNRSLTQLLFEFINATKAIGERFAELIARFARVWR